MKSDTFTVPRIPKCPVCGKANVSIGHYYGHQSAGKPRQFTQAEREARRQRLAIARQSAWSPEARERRLAKLNQTTNSVKKEII